MIILVLLLSSIAVLFLPSAIFNPITYISWLLLFFTYSLSNREKVKEFFKYSSKSILIGTLLGIFFGFIRFLMVRINIGFLNPGVGYYYTLLEKVPNGLYMILFLPLFLLMNFISTLFYNVLMQYELEKKIHWLVSILVMSVLFGAIHFVTPVNFDFNYGCVAFTGGILHGLLFRHYKNVYIPTLFLGMQLWVVFVLLWLFR